MHATFETKDTMRQTTGGGIRLRDVVLYGSIAVGGVVGFSLTGSAAAGTIVGVAVGLAAARAIDRHAA